MPAKLKLSLEERVALAMDIIRRTRPAREICAQYGVSHSTAYEIREAFVRGGREFLRKQSAERNLEERLRRIEQLVVSALGSVPGPDVAKQSQ